ncbi:MAG: DUF1735 domain-containing protein [Bacteroides sp.]|nr:DUF1735 domain-containing protein [Bacteroides sp.]
MKYYNYIKSSLLIAVFTFTGTLFTACEDDIEVGSNDGNIYDNIDGVYGYVKSVTGARELSPITFFGNNPGKAQVYFELSEMASEAVTVEFKIDPTALEKYNTANGTSYQIYPQSSVSFGNGGTASIAADEIKSGTVDVTISAGGSVGQTYALPITAEVKSGGISLSKNNQNYIFLVKPCAAIPDSDKGTGIKSILYIEVNDENILNAGEYTMKSSGKPFFDVVNIFAANINYNSETGRAYINCNENVSYILRNADSFIRPLQAKGIKVCLTILGNHDEAGVSNLSPEAAADFAREIKTYMDVYGLDGIDFDDEYSNYKTENPSPGLEVPSRAAAARLVYECRKIMPDKIVSFYDFGDYVPGGVVEGTPVGKLLDYAYYGLYGTWRDRHEDITGLDISKYCPLAINLNFAEGNGGYRMTYVEDIRTKGYGIEMFYNLKSIKYDYSELFNNVSNAIFDDGVNWTGVTYAKNSAVGTINKPSYTSYIGSWSTVSANSLYYYYAGPWWDWSGSMTTTLTFEEKVAGQSYNVYGWYGTADELPLMVNYNSETGRIEIPLPQTATDKNTKEEWLYMGRYQYPYSSAYWMNYSSQFIGYSGIINFSTIHLYAAPLPNYTMARTMSAVQIEDDILTEVKGETDKGIVWQPFTMSK